MIRWRLYSATILLALIAGCKKNNAAPPSANNNDAAAGCAGVLFSTHTVVITKYGMSPPELGLRGKAYQPRELSIKVCDKVIWENQDSRAQYHTATADNGEVRKYFNTGAIGAGSPDKPVKSRPIQFPEVGEFSYYCEPHPWMRGKISVTP